MAQLNQDQIESLYRFTRQHFVVHYDLQTELVDHMASGIERLWEKNDQLTFEQARDREFKKFGVFGFMDVVEKRQKAMNKRYSRLVWKHFIEYMKLPKVAGFILITFLTFLTLKLTSYSEAFFLGTIFTVLAVYIFCLYKARRKVKKVKTDDGKQWMLQDIIYNQGNMGGAIALLPLHFYNILGLNNFHQLSDFWFAILSLVICGLFLFMYIMSVEIPKRAEEYLKDTYPEYKLS